MGLEPAFSQNTVAWPLAGPFVLPLEPDDPDFTIPQGSLQSWLRDTPERNYIADASGELPTVPDEPLAIARTSQPGRKWKAAVVFSCVLHAAAAIAFLVTGDEPVLIEGADQAGIMLLGNAPEDRSAAGDMREAPSQATKVTLVTMLDPKPVRTVDAEPVAEMETTQPVETTEAEARATATLEPLRETPDRPISAADRIDPVTDEPATAPTANALPEILAVDRLQPVEEDNTVQKPAQQSTTTVEATEAIADKTVSVETSEKVSAETEPQLAPAKKKPQPAKPRKAEPAKKPIKKTQQAEGRKKDADAKKKVEKATANQASSGSGGQSEADARRGAADSEADGKTSSKSQGGKSGIGNASVSNYPGKVAAKLRRALRGIPGSARAKARNDVQVTFVVSAGGGVGSIRVARSSGSPELDAAALAVIRRAAPFPPIPVESGRSSWAFTLPLGLAR